MNGPDSVSISGLAANCQHCDGSMPRCQDSPIAFAAVHHFTFPFLKSTASVGLGPAIRLGALIAYQAARNAFTIFVLKWSTAQMASLYHIGAVHSHAPAAVADIIDAWLVIFWAQHGSIRIWLDDHDMDRACSRIELHGLKRWVKICLHACSPIVVVLFSELLTEGHDYGPCPVALSFT